MSNLTFMGLMKVSVIMPLLLICSIVLIAYTLERLLYYLRAGKIKGIFIIKIKEFVRRDRIKEAIELCEETPGILSEVVKTGLENSHLARLDAEDSMDTVKIRGENLLKKHLTIFGTLSFISPLLGLLGTVLGIIKAFHDVALSGSGGPTIVAAGISEALITTVAGIAVAVPAAIIYNYFTSQMQNIMVRIDTFAQELIILLYGQRTVERRANVEEVK